MKTNSLKLVLSLISVRLAFSAISVDFYGGPNGTHKHAFSKAIEYIIKDSRIIRIAVIHDGKDGEALSHFVKHLQQDVTVSVWSTDGYSIFDYKS